MNKEKQAPDSCLFSLVIATTLENLKSDVIYRVAEE
jgi:hypothetical protein